MATKFNMGYARGFWKREKNIRFKMISDTSFANHLLRIHETYCTVCRPWPDSIDLEQSTLKTEIPSIVTEVELISDSSRSKAPEVLEEIEENETTTEVPTIAEEELISDSSRSKVRELLKEIEENQRNYGEKLGNCLDIMSSSGVVEIKDNIFKSQFSDLEAEHQLDTKMKQLNQLNTMCSNKRTYSKVKAHDLVKEIDVHLCEQDQSRDLDMECHAAAGRELAIMQNELLKANGNVFIKRKIGCKPESNQLTVNRFIPFKKEPETIIIPTTKTTINNSDRSNTKKDLPETIVVPDSPDSSQNTPTTTSTKLSSPISCLPVSQLTVNRITPFKKEPETIIIPTTKTTPNILKKSTLW